MTDRSGPFWDAAAGRIPMPLAAQTLGLGLIGFDEERAEIELSFDNQRGHHPRNDLAARTTYDVAYKEESHGRIPKISPQRWNRLSVYHRLSHSEGSSNTRRIWREFFNARSR